MKFSYKFSNLLGTVYHRGNTVFTKDGNSIISPVGNKVSIFNLKENRSETLPIESRYSIRNLTLSPCGNILIVINEVGQGLVCSLVSKTVLHRHNFSNKVRSIRYSPDGKYVAVAKGKTVFVYHAPGSTMKQFHAFSIVHALKGFHDDVQCLDWTSDSKFVVAGSRDMTSRVFSVALTKNFRPCCLSGHMDSVVACFFVENSLDLYTLSRNGTLIIWNSNVALEEIVILKEEYVSSHERNGGDDVVEQDGKKQTETDDSPVFKRRKEDDKKDHYESNYKKEAMHLIKKLVQSDRSFFSLTSGAYHPKTKILVSGFSNGAFFLHEMPEFNLIHSLSIADQSISTMCFNCTGDWLSFASGGLGQLVVWEWQSETYVLKQQGHFNNMNCLTYSPDGQFLVTGGDDGKVKVWNMSSGFCFVTFTEHSSGVTGVSYTQNGKVVVSSSLDGTVRAFDLTRYRNFKTFTSPKPTQFASLALDSSGEIICAGGQDNFEIFVWSMQNGRLLEILSGHEAPVGSLSFSPSDAVLVSASWDKTLRIWDVFSGKGSRETMHVLSDALAVTFRSDGVELAVATLNGQITFFEVKDPVQVGSIEGRKDIGSGRRDTDLVSARQIQKGKAFTSLCYTADGECILAAGQAKYVCIYHVKQQILIKKFEITQNRSFDAVDDFINRRKMTEFGNIALVEERDPDDDDEQRAVSVALPGVKKGEMASRAYKPEVRVSSIRFSPTGRSWAAATTEGLLVYSLDSNLVFDPLELETDITTSSIRETLLEKEYSKALMMALKLKEHKLVVEVVENISPDEVRLVVSSLSDRYLERFIAFLGDQLESSAHLEFYLAWAENLLMIHGQQLKDKSLSIMSLLHNLQRTIIHKRQHLEKICDYNKYTLQYILTLGEIVQKKAKMKVNEEDADSEDEDRNIFSVGDEMDQD